MNSETIKVHATFKDIRQPSAHLRSLLASHQIAEDTINGCELALQELLTNVVEHAYQGDGNKLITVSLSYKRSYILIETQDTGQPARVDLNSVALPDPTELQEGGYGIAIIAALMDEVKYSFERGRNIWKLFKKL